jgi:two-component system cell cycle sensor histidine kinase/response regulator CckA
MKFITSSNSPASSDAGVLDSLRAAIFVLDSAGNVLGMNNYAERYCGCRDTEAVGSSWTALIDAPPGIQASVARALASREVFECEAAPVSILRTRTRGIALLELAPIQNGAGAYLLLRDLTRETRFRRARHLESLQLMAGGVAQQLNNLISSAQGCIEDLGGRLARAGVSNDPLRALQDATKRTTSLALQLRAFGRTAAADPKKLDLNSVLSSIQSAIVAALARSVQLEIVSETYPATVEADRVHVQEILLNIATHAGRSIPEGGRLTIRVAACTVSEQETLAHADFSPGDYVQVAFEHDRTPGDYEEERVVFEPFAHTAASWAGGVELPAAFGLLRQAGGYLIKAGDATCSEWLLYWPVALDASALWPAAGEEARGESVLVVEQHADSILSSSDVLLYRGYRVIEANNGPEALRVMKQQRQPIDVMLTDLFMPAMGGLELATEVKKISPETSVVFMSGYSAEILRQHGFPRDASLVRKPCSPEVLAKTVRGVLSTAHV